MTAPLWTRRAALAGGAAAAWWAWRPTAARPAPPATRELVAARAAAAPAGSTAPLAYNGSVPGPLIRLRLGEPLVLRFVNRLDSPTALSFPGLRTANSDAGIAGLAGATLAPGEAADIRFTPPDAGFNLYLPEAGAATDAQLASGLFGPIVVDEPTQPEVDLEAIVVVADRPVAESAAPSIIAGPAAAPQRFSAPAGARVRLRLANASAGRLMTVAVAGVAPLIVAVDGQPSAAFAPLRNAFPIAPGARFELIFDMVDADVAFALRSEREGEPDRPLAVFANAGPPKPARPAFAGLAANPLLPNEIDLARARRFELTVSGGDGKPLAINGESLTDWGAKPQFAVARGAPVTLALANATAQAQVMRLGGHVARLLHALDDGWEPYWRDVFVVPPGKIVRLAFVADNPGKWPIASAAPAARAAGLSGWFAVG